MIATRASRWYRWLFALAVVTLAACQTETPLEEAAPDPPAGLQVLSLPQLPPAIREQAFSVGSALQKQAHSFKNERSFGTVANGRIHRVERPGGRVSYTLPLRKMGTGLYYDNLVIEQLPDGTTTETLIRYEPQREWWQQSQGVYDYATYSGQVSLFTASGEPIASVVLQEGKIAPSHADKTGTPQRLQLSCYITDVQYAGLEQDGVFYVTDIMYWVECEISSDGNTDPDSGSYDAGGGGSGVGSAPTGEPEYAEDGGGTAGSGDSPGGEAEEQITTTLPPCLDSIVNNLQTLQTGKLAEIIQQFAGNNPIPENYNWNITTGSCITVEATACTTPFITNGSVTTTINSEGYPNATELSMARTIMHEAFHAYLVSVYRYRNIDKSYVNLMNQYASEYNDNPNDIHHQVFTLINVVGSISTALMEYGANNGYNLTQQFCDDMAWAGLQGTAAYNNLPLEQRMRIENTLLAELTNTNVNGTLPQGTEACPE